MSGGLLSRVLLRTVLACFLAAIALAIGMTLFDGWDRTLPARGFSVMLTSALATGALLGVRHARSQGIPAALDVASSAVIAVAWVMIARAVILGEIGDTDGMLMVLAGGWGFALLAICLVASLERRPGTVRALRWVPIGLIVLAGALGTAMAGAAMLDMRGGALFGPLFGLASLAAVIALGVYPSIVRRSAGERSKERETVDQDWRVGLACPDCGTEGTSGEGLWRCPGCRRGLVIAVDEPRCECGYPLYRLAGDTCPECGAAVPHAERYRARA